MMKKIAGAAFAVLLAPLLALVPVEAAAAEPLVSVAVADRPDLVNVAAASGQTRLTVSGTGFQSIPNGFGGIYVLFGWVDPAGGWQPSAGGVTGTNYRYAMDDETSPQGFQQFLAFPGGATEGAASGGLIGADGSWSTTITTPGPAFTSVDRDFVETRVDCLEVQCGIITIGAHGVANANNESFTPVTFTSLDAAATPSPEPAGAAIPSDTAAPTDAVPPTPSPDAVATADRLDPVTGVWVGIAAGAVVVAVVAVAFWLARRRRSARRSSPSSSSD